MPRFFPYWLGYILSGVAFLSVSVLGAEFRTTREQAIVYADPTSEAKKLSILSADYPVEILDRDDTGWLKIRDMTGATGWIQDRSTSVRKRVIVRSDDAEILRRPDANSRLAFRAEKGIVLDQLSSPDSEGWVHVRIPNTRQEGYVKTSRIWGVERRRDGDPYNNNDQGQLQQVASHSYSGSRYEPHDYYPSRRRYESEATKIRRERERRRELLRQLKVIDRDLARYDRQQQKRRRELAYRSRGGRDPEYSYRDRATRYPARLAHRSSYNSEIARRSNNRYGSSYRDTERERLREERLRAERVARTGRSYSEEYRPAIYSTHNHISYTRNNDWDYGYNDNDKDHDFSPPQVHH